MEQMSEDQEYRDKPLLPTWLWVVLIAVLIVVIAVVLFGLGGDTSSTNA
jgi:hypothetical protein